MVYLALNDGDAQSRARLLNTSNEQRLRQRTRKQFGHSVKVRGCALHLYDEHELGRCLAGGLRVLNVGSDVAVNIQRGLGRLNSSTQAWTRRRPGDAAEQRLPFAKRQPSVADWAYQFERTGGFNSRVADLMVGRAQFGSGSVQTLFIHHPPHQGLANVIEPETVAASAGGRVGFRKAGQYERFMCEEHDVVVFESGAHDLGMPFYGPQLTYGRNTLRPACAAAASVAACEALLLPAMRNERWRLHPLEAYRMRLRALLQMWVRCRRAKPRFRAIFKLAPAPRPRLRPAECDVAQWGFSTDAQHVREANDLANQMVRDAGFEVFAGGYALALHAPAPWFDDVRHGVKYKIHEAEALSDLETQLLINQLCGPGNEAAVSTSTTNRDTGTSPRELGTTRLWSSTGPRRRAKRLHEV